MRERGKYFSKLFESLHDSPFVGESRSKKNRLTEKMKCMRCGGKGTTRVDGPKYTTLDNCHVCKGTGYLESVQEKSNVRGEAGIPEDDVRAAIPDFHETPDVVEEHGQLWAVCSACGWQASANESNEGVDLETVTEGDGSCEGKAESSKPKKNRLTESASSKFVASYIETALWSSTDESTPSGGEPMDRNYGPEDIESSTRSKMKSDCDKFVQQNEKDLDACGLDDELAGHCFWLNRNGHGTGFWDRAYETKDEVEKAALGKLDKASNRFGEFNLYVGDDGKIYGSGG